MPLDLYSPELFQRSGSGTLFSGPLSGLAIDGKGPIHSSKDVSGVELRMLPPLIIENRTTPVWPFPGYSQLYCFTIVISDVTNQLAGVIDIKGFPRIGDQEYLPVNKTIFYWQASETDNKSPSQLHVLCSVIKSKKGLRKFGEIMSSLKSDEDYNATVATIAKIAKNTAKINIVTDLVMQLGALVGKHLGNVEDKPIGTVLNSYTTLHGDFDKLGVQKLVYPTKDVQFSFDLVVRNKSAEIKMAKEIGSRSLKLEGKRKLNLAAPEKEQVKVDMQPL